MTYQVIAANELVPETFRNHDRHGFNVYLQTAFAARQGQLLAGPDGRPLGFIRRLRQEIAAPSVFSVDSAATAEIAHLYEHAGLFAWQETSENVATWDASRILQSVVQASMSLQLCEDGDYDRLAIFDPFLRAGAQEDDPTQPVTTLGERAGKGAFPVSREFSWHGGIHLDAPGSGDNVEPVRAIADGQVVFARNSDEIPQHSDDPTVIAPTRCCTTRAGPAMAW
ncbi:hypothetical protein PPMP20_01785 [Paraburkholderia phymatum]|uniref:Uncharacterized protein n=1 Tax=Paraburkholderia phymatum (strain DSM 17167 / CIP 108236 / LMG 21445 / STM815) TaxID=391038 RepID=B2JW58_PARP8|nr:hypothetical protein [Paraburkholderia phymatum]ACC75185.1 hypothetical protein Bphy_6128 [Paraburkholderia phymatum STM815]